MHYYRSLRENEWLEVSSETYFLTEYVANLTSSFIHGGISLNLQCELSNCCNKNYLKCVVGASRIVGTEEQQHPRSLERRKSHNERLHRQAVLKYALEGLFIDLGVNMTMIPRHKTYESISIVEGCVFASVDKIASVVTNYAMFAIRVR